MKHAFALLLAFCSIAAAQDNRSEEIFKRFQKFHAPTTRVIGSQTYDLTPLLRWMALDLNLKRHTARPAAFGNWFEVSLSSYTRTNGWAVSPSGNGFIAVKHLPTNFVAGPIIAYALPNQVYVPYGSSQVRAVAYDFGLIRADKR